MTVKQHVSATAALAALIFAASAAPAHADRLGVRVGYYTDVEEPFVGFELLLPLGSRVYLNPNVEYVFVEDVTYMTFNGDFHYDFPTHGRAYAWAGAGLAVLYANPDGPIDSETDVGANFLFGVGARGDVIPYLQAKLIVSDDTEFVIAAGIRF